MRGGAFIVGLAAVVLLALVWAQRWTVGSCDFEQKLITPDGKEFVFTGPRIVPGTLDMDWPLEGEGLPPIEHLSQEIYGMPGALYKGTVVKPRVLIISSTIHGVTTTALMDMKARMQSALRWDRVGPGLILPMPSEPSVYRITVNGVSRDLYVRYNGAVERRVGRPGRVVVVAIRLISFDVFWTDPETEEQVLDWGDSSTVRYFASRVGGLWEQDITQPAAVAPGVGGPNVWAIAVDPETGDVIVGGNFTNWDNIAAGDYVVRWDVSAGAWTSIGGGLNDWVFSLYFGPDGTLYAGGAFLNGSGGAGDPLADYIARYDPLTDTWINVGGGPGAGAVTNVRDIIVGHDGTMYVTGWFLNWNGIAAADYIVRLPMPYAGGAWAALGTGLNSMGYALGILPNGNLVCGSNATTYGGVACNYIGKWDGAAWSALGSGTNGTVYALGIHPDGTLYIGGVFLTASGNTVNRIARWNGAAWSDLDGGVSSNVETLSIGTDGMVYAGGLFTTAGSLTLTDRVARWNGFSWVHLDIDLPGAAGVYALLAHGDDLYLGYSDAGTAAYAADNTAVDAGNAFALPIIEIKNQGLLQSVRNETMGHDIPCDMLIQDGEIVTIDLSPGVKSCESNWRGNRLGDILPASDMATFCLESYPRANHGGVEGANLITVFITDAAAREHNDGGNQLSGWDNITGISQHNTDLGRLYASIVVVGGGFNRVDFYSDAARAAADLVAHTANYNGAGAQAIIADNASGLGGTITIDAVGAGDTDIFTYYTVATLRWVPRWWDLDAAVS